MSQKKHTDAAKLQNKPESKKSTTTETFSENGKLVDIKPVPPKIKEKN